MSGDRLPLHTSTEEYAESRLNLAILNPTRYGWTAGGGVAYVLPPHEVRNNSVGNLRVPILSRVC